MPVSLEDMMRELSPDRQTAIEREAHALAAGHRQLSHHAGAEECARISPPAGAEALLTLQMRDGLRDAVLSDLADEFRTNITRHGLRRAQLMYWVETVGSLLPMLMINTSRLIAPRWLADRIRRHF